MFSFYQIYFCTCDKYFHSGEKYFHARNKYEPELVDFPAALPIHPVHPPPDFLTDKSSWMFSILSWTSLFQLSREPWIPHALIFHPPFVLGSTSQNITRIEEFGSWFPSLSFSIPWISWFLTVQSTIAHAETLFCYEIGLLGRMVVHQSKKLENYSHN